MDCRTLRELADALAGETPDVRLAADLHLEQCPDCRHELAARRALRAKLQGAIARSVDLAPRTEFAAELARTLQPPPPQSSTVVVSRRSLLRSWWALAAGIVMASGGGAWLVHNARGRARLASLARLAAGDHLNCAVHFNLAEAPIPLEEAGRLHGGPFTALATFVPSVAGAPIDVLARHACVYDGCRFGHVVLRYQNAVASLLVTEGDPPGTAALVSAADGPAVASLPAGRFAGFVVADLERNDVLRLAQALAPALSRHLS